MAPIDTCVFSGMGVDVMHGTFVMSLETAVNWNMQDCALHNGQINLGEAYYNSDVFGPGAVAWNNNLFDRVSINIDPFYRNWANTVLPVSAYNNLFRQGFLALTPQNYSGPSEQTRTFSDNLFDQEVFYQDPNQTISVDYNAYWPCLPQTPFYWQNDGFRSDFYGFNAAGQLAANSGGGTGIVTLPTAPPYQAGPFGNYYLPDTTPLHQAGSRTPVAACLYQYTTSADQATEGVANAGQNANIGLHYIAATNTAAGWVPTDWDRDGIPDYVEDSSGTGQTTVIRS